MGARVRGVAVVAVILAVGAFLGSAAAQWWSAAPPASRAAGPQPMVDERVRVEVLNGAGRDGWARDATSWLRDRGFDVVDYGNVPGFGADTSVVFDRVGRPDHARAVADALGITVVRSQPDSNLYLDVSVVLGEDWELPTAEPASTSEPVPWWDVRRFFRSEVDSSEDGTSPPGRMVDPGVGEDAGS